MPDPGVAVSHAYNGKARVLLDECDADTTYTIGGNALLQRGVVKLTVQLACLFQRRRLSRVWVKAILDLAHHHAADVIGSNVKSNTIRGKSLRFFADVPFGSCNKVQAEGAHASYALILY